MRIFIKELEQRHRAKVGALIKRHKAGIGYVILMVGVIIALVGVNKNLNQGETQRNELRHTQHAQAVTQAQSKHRDEQTRAVICENITRQDRQTLINLHTKVDKELIKNLHLTQKQVDESVKKQLTLSAEERQALKPSDPATACSSAITTLVKGKPPTIRENILGKHFTPETASAPSTKSPRTTPTKPSAPTPRSSTPAPKAAPAPRPHAPAPKAVTPPKAGGSSPSVVAHVPTPSPSSPPPLITPIPTQPAPAPQPPLVRVPPVTAGPVTTPEITVGVTK